jgi:GNAT superfamily N-acetyltransferase
MKIIQAVTNDLVEVLYLLKECVADMNDKGIKHWNNSFPGSEIMSKAIEAGSLYLYKETELAKGMVILNEEEPEEYKKIDWGTKSEKVLYIKYLAVHPQWQGQGIARKLVAFAEEFAREHGYQVLRTDLYSGLEASGRFSEDLGFTKSGQFHSSFQQAPYLALQKSL